MAISIDLESKHRKFWPAIIPPTRQLSSFLINSPTIQYVVAAKKVQRVALLFIVFKCFFPTPLRNDSRMLQITPGRT